MAVRWGIIGCGDVTEVKSGPGFQHAHGSALTAVMRRNLAKAEDYARRHGVARAYDRADALVEDPAVDAVYVATPPSTHLELALLAAAAGKPCLVEKPMAMNYEECLEMIEAFRARRVPLWVAYYRRALPRFLAVRERLASGAIGRVTSVHVQVTERLAGGGVLSNWRFDPAVAGAGLFLDLASHCVDLLDFLAGPISDARGFAINTGRAYPAEDVTAAAFGFEGGLAGTGIWNFNANDKTDAIVFTGTRGTITTPVFTDGDVHIDIDGCLDVLPIRNPPHVHQPLIQTIVDELGGHGRCESTGDSGARATWVMDRCLESYRAVQGSMNSIRVPSGS
jgi:1,5-anhydro-D-fructose reductase (1,5-anhydro-D-mannitol-forming)